MELTVSMCYKDIALQMMDTNASRIKKQRVKAHIAGRMMELIVQVSEIHTVNP